MPGENSGCDGGASSSGANTATTTDTGNGPATASSSSFQVHQGTLQYLDQAMSMLSNEETHEYMEAKRRCPELVMSESDPTRFLRCESYDNFKAALRLSKYWKKRVKIFGKDRAFLPMLLSSEEGSALSAQDVSVIKSGYIFILPTDKYGHTVCCSDRSRIPPSLSRESTDLKAFFFMLQAASENVKNQTSGIVCLVVLPCQINSGHMAKSWDLATTLESSEILSECMPMKNRAVHIISCAPKPARKLFRETIIPITMERIGVGSCIPKTICQTHLGDPPDILQKLLGYGLKQEGIPSSLGGNWDYEEGMASWTAERCKLEQAKPLSRVVRQEFPPPEVPPPPYDDEKRASDSKPPVATMASSPEQQQREKALIHVSKIRAAQEHRLELLIDDISKHKENAADLAATKVSAPSLETRIEIDNKHKLESHPSAKTALPLPQKQNLEKPKEKNNYTYRRPRAQTTNEKLSLLNEQLSTLQKPPSAKRMATADGGTNSQGIEGGKLLDDGEAELLRSKDLKAFQRKRNAIYSRRKYIRKKIEIEVLEKQTSDLRSQNKSMKRESVRLESLLYMAKKRVAFIESSPSKYMQHGAPEQGIQEEFGSPLQRVRPLPQDLSLASLLSETLIPPPPQMYSGFDSSLGVAPMPGTASLIEAEAILRQRQLASSLLPSLSLYGLPPDAGSLATDPYSVDQQEVDNLLLKQHLNHLNMRSFTNGPGGGGTGINPSLASQGPLTMDALAAPWAPTFTSANSLPAHSGLPPAVGCDSWSSTPSHPPPFSPQHQRTSLAADDHETHHERAPSPTVSRPPKTSSSELVNFLRERNT